MTRSPLAKYLVLQSPGWMIAAGVLWLFVWHGDLAPPIGLLLFGLWLLKDFLLYPILKKSYEDGPRDGTGGLVGALASVRERLDPEGWVRVGSELWRAEVADGQAPIEPGAAVRVVEVRGFTLRVEKA